MTLLPWLYKVRGRPAPYYAHYPLWVILWKPIRKFINVVVTPNCPFSSWRIGLYRMIGFSIGKRCFIGMQCYMDDIEPQNTRIGNDVTISYGVYFATHGHGQKHTTVTIEDRAFVGMRASFVSGVEGIVIGTNSVIGASPLRSTYHEKGSLSHAAFFGF